MSKKLFGATANKVSFRCSNTNCFPIPCCSQFGVFYLVDTGEKFLQEGRAAELHKDFGIYAQLKGPNQTKIALFGSLQYTSFAHIVRMITDNETYNELKTSDISWKKKLTVFEVNGLDRMSIDVRFLKQIDIEAKEISTNEK